MSLLEIISIPDPILRKKSAPIERIDDDLKRLMEQMLATMYDAPGIGLAAVQVGVPRRLVTLDVVNKETAEGEVSVKDPLFLINPEILWKSDERGIYEEGCLSIPEYYAEVERPAKIRFAYTDKDGKRQEREAEGLLAVCVQHEVDHLDGKLFIDHISKLKRDMVVKKFQKAAKTGVKPTF
ncbi:MAG: peptide deformylase [Bauldia sp.]